MRCRGGRHEKVRVGSGQQRLPEQNPISMLVASRGEVVRALEYIWARRTGGIWPSVALPRLPTPTADDLVFYSLGREEMRPSWN